MISVSFDCRSDCRVVIWLSLDSTEELREVISVSFDCRSDCRVVIWLSEEEDVDVREVLRNSISPSFLSKSAFRLAIEVLRDFKFDFKLAISDSPLPNATLSSPCSFSFPSRLSFKLPISFSKSVNFLFCPSISPFIPLLSSSKRCCCFEANCEDEVSCSCSCSLRLLILISASFCAESFRVVLACCISSNCFWYEFDLFCSCSNLD